MTATRRPGGRRAQDPRGDAVHGRIKGQAGREKGGAPTLLTGTSRCATPGCARGRAARRPAWRGDATPVPRGARGPAAAARHPSDGSRPCWSLHLPLRTATATAAITLGPPSRPPRSQRLQRHLGGRSRRTAPRRTTIPSMHRGPAPGYGWRRGPRRVFPSPRVPPALLDYSSQYAGDAGPRSVGPTALPTSDLSYSPAPTPRKMASEEAAETR